VPEVVVVATMQRNISPRLLGKQSLHRQPAPRGLPLQRG
jgi:hypothetical protein